MTDFGPAVNVHVRIDACCSLCSLSERSLPALFPPRKSFCRTRADSHSHRRVRKRRSWCAHEALEECVLRRDSR